MFEGKLELLEEIIERVEDGETPLEDALALYKDGANLIRECGEILQAAEDEVLILQKAAEGYVTAPLACEPKP